MMDIRRIRVLCSTVLILTMLFGNMLPHTQVAAATNKQVMMGIQLEEGKAYYAGVANLTSKITWTSSNKKVATVTSNGKITAVKAGTTVITATSNGKQYQFQVKVTPKIALNKTKVSVMEGNTYALKLNNATETVTWTSSNKKVATVTSKGKVTAVKAGQTTITATSNGVKYECVVTVEKETVLKPISAQEAVSQIKKSKIGDTVLFGSYEQDNDLSNGAEAIEWLVLDKNGSQYLLLSKVCLDAQPYDDVPVHYTFSDVTWETCTLRKWLNDSFYKKAFSRSEQGYIATTMVRNDDNEEYGTDGGSHTRDKVFLLSNEEVTDYFGVDLMKENKTATAKVTKYAIANGASVYSEGSYWGYDKSKGYDGNTKWWLRTPGYSHLNKLAIDVNGKICGGYGENNFFYAGEWVERNDVSVRPAMWVDLSGATSEVNRINLTSVDKIKSSQIGDTVVYGNYEQDDKITNGTEAIEWIVMDKKDGKYLLLSKYCLDNQPFNTSSKNVSWEESTLRNWLNGSFYKTAFSKAERVFITDTDVTYSDMSGGVKNGTKDKLFLLSVEEARQYYGSLWYEDGLDNPARSAKATQYAKAQGLRPSTISNYYGDVIWWLRSTVGGTAASAIGVQITGSIGQNGSGVTNNMGVRPAMWIEP